MSKESKDSPDRPAHPGLYVAWMDRPDPRVSREWQAHRVREGWRVRLALLGVQVAKGLLALLDRLVRPVLGDQQEPEAPQGSQGKQDPQDQQDRQERQAHQGRQGRADHPEWTAQTGSTPKPSRCINEIPKEPR